MTATWKALTPRFYPGPGARARLGLLVLATDMAIEQDIINFTRLDGVDCFASRMPMSQKVTRRHSVRSKPRSSLPRQTLLSGRTLTRLRLAVRVDR